MIEVEAVAKFETEQEIPVRLELNFMCATEDEDEAVAIASQFLGKTVPDYEITDARREYAT